MKAKIEIMKEQLQNNSIHILLSLFVHEFPDFLNYTFNRCQIQNARETYINHQKPEKNMVSVKSI